MTPKGLLEKCRTCDHPRASHGGDHSKGACLAHKASWPRLQMYVPCDCPKFKGNRLWRKIVSRST